MARKRRSRQFKKSSRVIDMDEARRQRQEKRRAIREAAEKEQTSIDERRVRRKRALRKKQGRRRLIIAAILIAMALMLSASIVNIVKLKKEQGEVRARQEQLKEEKKQLEKDLKNTNNKESIEDQAREKLKLVKPGETIYIHDDEE